MSIVLSKDICRLSTISTNHWPHTVPVGYVYQNGKFYVPSAPNTKKLRNLERNGRATLLVDDEDSQHGLMIECKSKILRDAEASPFLKFMRGVKKWQNDQKTVVIELDPQRKVSWFLK